MPDAPAARPKAGWIDRYRYRRPKDGVEFLTLKLAVERSRLVYHAVVREMARRKCRYLGRQLRSIKVPPPAPCRYDRITVYSAEDCDTIGRARKALEERPLADGWVDSKTYRNAADRQLYVTL